jgi:hypothetical protein
MKDKMSSIYQNRQSELKQLFIEAEEYELLKGKAQDADSKNWKEQVPII